jgi:TPP-dependent pyruvate/acetoin dehydrogenase alpha subunit
MLPTVTTRAAFLRMASWHHFNVFLSFVRTVISHLRFVLIAHRLGAAHFETIYRTLLAARLVDDRLGELFKKRHVGRQLFSGAGQEAGPAVVSSFLRQTDWIIPPYRGYVHVLGKGLSLTTLFSELLGRTTGSVEGRGNPGNFISPELGIYANSDILGNNFPTAVGMAYAKRYQNSDGIVVSYFGDGTATRSVLYGSLNLSVVWKLPILWVCENNGYSVTTSTEKMSFTPFAEKAAGFGMKAITVDGNDITALVPVVKDLIDHVRATGTPAFLELKTFRMSVHDATSTSVEYQDATERALWLARDPVVLAERRLKQFGLLSSHQLAKVKQEVNHEIDAAIEAALIAPLASPENVLRTENFR